MSEHLEGVVRPFQSPNVTPGVTVPTAKSVSAKNVILNVGRAGSVKQMSGSFSATATFYMKKIQTEESNSDN